MQQIQTSTLKKAALLAGLATTIALATRIDWALAVSKDMFLYAFGTYLGSVAIAFMPYAALWQELSKTAGYPTLQLFVTATLIFIAILVYVYFWSFQEQTGGWEILIVCFWQSVVVGCLYVIEKALRHAAVKDHA